MSEYISVVDTAKIIRKVLKDKFPDTKFSVKSDKYAGGASINISYFDGPVVKDVEAVVNVFRGAGFDGMVDYKYYNHVYRLADGSYTFAGTQGSAITGGLVDEVHYEKPEGAVEVHFGSDYISVNRKISKSLMMKAVKATAEKFNNQFDVDATLNAIVDDDYGSYIGNRMGDKYVFDGSDKWDMHWCVGTQVREVLSEMKG